MDKQWLRMRCGGQMETRVPWIVCKVRLVEIGSVNVERK